MPLLAVALLLARAGGHLQRVLAAAPGVVRFFTTIARVLIASLPGR